MKNLWMVSCLGLLVLSACKQAGTSESSGQAYGAALLGGNGVTLETGWRGKASDSGSSGKDGQDGSSDGKHSDDGEVPAVVPPVVVAPPPVVPPVALPPVSAYIADASSGLVRRCLIDAKTALMSQCQQVQGNVPGWRPRGIALNPPKTFAYVADENNRNVYVCSVMASGDLESCQVSNGGALWYPASIALETQGASTHAIVVDDAHSLVYSCAVDSTTGLLSGCVQSTASVVAPIGVTTHLMGGTTYGYVVDDSVNGTANIYVCVVAGDGSMNGCIASNGGATGWAPFGIALTQLGSATFAHVVDNLGKVYVCSVGATGLLGGCVDSGAGVPDWHPTSIALKTIGGVTYALIGESNASHGNLYQCSVNSQDGTMSHCAVANGGESGWATPMGIALQQ